ncbi:MAG: TonB-dependent receptor [Ignavibacteriae bacterium]|nr:TonB-dependent receptor [Ignavibacteriota bacterium]
MKLILTALFFIINYSFFAQGNVSLNALNGIVIDSQTNEPLPFANIAVLNSTIGTTTNEKGFFSLALKDENSTFIISYVGYNSLTVFSENFNKTTLNIFTLTPKNINLQEVTIFANNLSTEELTQLSNISMQSEIIREISSGMPDILRSVQSLPGVVVNNEFKADFNVRGGNQDENLVLVNGTQVYEPYHIKEAENASVGVFNVDLMKKVDIITGGFPAKYGDKMSSVLNIEYREGSKEKYSGAASLSLAYVDGYFEGPISEKSSFIFGFRKSYLEYILSMIDYEEIKTVKPSFYDIQGVLSYQISPKSKLLFEFIHAGDDFTYNPERIYSSKIESEKNNADYLSSLLDVKSKNILSSKMLLNFEISYYSQLDDENRLFNRFEDINNNRYDSIQTIRNTFDKLKINTFEIKTDLSNQVNSIYEIQSGINFQNIYYKQNSADLWTYIAKFKNVSNSKYDTLQRNGDFGLKEPIDANSFKLSGYIENILSLTNSITLNIGGRVDYFDINKDLTFSPRINTAFKLNDGSVLKAAWGYFYQSPIYAQLSSSASSDTNTQSQKSIHYILGFEKQLNISPNSYMKFKLETYYKDYNNLISSQFGVFERLTYSRENDAKGNAKGFDVYAILNSNWFYGWLSYGYLDAKEDKFDDNIGEYPRYTNQTHTISVVSNFDLGNSWSISLKGYYGSGFPYTPKTAVKDEATGIWDWHSGKTHSANLPAYKRVDFRMSKIFNFTSFKMNVFLDISNTLNFKNVQRYEFGNPGLTKPVAEEILLWPIIPSIGIRVEF